MNTTKTLLTLATALLISVFSFAQDKETRKVGAFDAISVGQSIEVKLIPGSKQEVIVEVDGTDLDNVITDASGGKLRIKMERGSYRNVDVKVTVTYKELNALDISSSAKVFSEGVIKSSDFDLEVSSSGAADLELDVDKIDIDISSSGKAKLKGNAGDMDIEVNSSGKLYAFALQGKDVDVEANSSGKAEISLNGSLNAEANSSGKVIYKGDPTNVMADSNSSGKVTKAD